MTPYTPWRRTLFALVPVIVVALMTSACAPGGSRSAVDVTTTSLAPRAACADTFVAHDLDHVTRPPGDVVTMFDGLGAGLAVNDLDGDGDLDLALAGLGGDTRLLWNDGDLRFRAETLATGPARGVWSVDVDGDNALDLVLTSGIGPPRWWRNVAGRFEPVTTTEWRRPALAVDWADLNGDGALDMVAAGYDALLEHVQGDAFLFGPGAGVWVYTQADGRFTTEQLAEASQALALLLHDVDGDGRTDILVGNDFVVPDMVWRRTAGGWTVAHPFTTITHSTMSFAAGDVDNDGRDELLATDMKPYAMDADTMAAWRPVMERMTHATLDDDPQVMANAFQARAGDGYTEEAGARGLGATGWSWSGKFGDLDNDGLLDVYVVNGMRADELFDHLPGAELVEENQARRNVGAGRFVPAPEWGLNARTSGRGMSLADLDGDGDLDVVVNNLGAPAQLFENQLCAGAALTLDLFWPASANSRALGATAVLVTDAGRLTRTVRAGSGYLAGDPARLHFGFPATAVLQALEITWPDGRHATLESLSPNSHLRVTRP